MTESLFVAISDRRIAELIDHAKDRVALTSPGLGDHTAEALVTAAKRLGPERVFVVVDCDEEVFRLGYGDIGALNKVTESGQVVGQSSGLRIGVLVCDETAWTFSPTALYVESEVHSDETPNAVRLPAEDAERILSRIVPKKSRETVVKPDSTPPLIRALKDSLSGMLPSAEKLDRDLARKAFRAVRTAFQVHAEEDDGTMFQLQVLLDTFASAFGVDNLAGIRPYIEYSWEQLRQQEGALVEDADFASAFAEYETGDLPKSGLAQELASAEVEVGCDAVSSELLKRTCTALDHRPRRRAHRR
jgi:hypothetical protein